MIKTSATKIDELVLDSRAQVIGERVLHSAANEPAHVVRAAAAKFAEVIKFGDSLMKVEIPERHPSRNVGQPLAESVTDARPHRCQIMGLERRRLKITLAKSERIVRCRKFSSL